MKYVYMVDKYVRPHDACEELKMDWSPCGMLIKG